MAILDSISTEESQAWLLALPQSQALQMTSAQFTTAARNRFHVDHPTLPPGLLCSCSDHTPIDTKGIHLQKCDLLKQTTIATHNGVTAELKTLCSLAGNFSSTTFPDPFASLL